MLGKTGTGGGIGFHLKGGSVRFGRAAASRSPLRKRNQMPSTLAGLAASQSRARQGELVEQALLWAFVAALAWTPYWYGSNDLIAWGANALLFPGLAVLFELRLLIAAKPHPVGIRAIALPAALFIAVV